MSEICIQLFGRFCVRRDGQVVAGLEADMLQNLFSYLLLHQRSAHARESLASILWPETTTVHAKKRLRQVLWQLHSALDSHAEVPVLQITADQVQINPEAGIWLDVAAFEKAFAGVQGITGQQLDTRHVQALNAAIQLYRGPLLDGCYEEWCLDERERLQNIYLAMLEKLMCYSDCQHDYEAGIQYGKQILACDRVHERTYRRLMRLYYLNGDRANALRIYELCSHALNEELGVKPAQRTIAFYKQILAEHLAMPESGNIPVIMPGTPGNASAPLIEVLDSLTHLQEALADLQSQVQQSMQYVERSLSENAAPFPRQTKTKEGAAYE